MPQFLSALSYLAYIVDGKVHPAACYRARGDGTYKKVAKRKAGDTKTGEAALREYAEHKHKRKKSRMSVSHPVAAAVAHIITHRGNSPVLQRVLFHTADFPSACPS